MKIYFRTRITSLLTIFLIGIATIYAVPAFGVIVDRIVAIVNDKVITLSELEKKAEPLFRQYLSPDMSQEQRETTRQQIMAQVLPQLVDDVLVDEEIEKNGLTATDQEIEQAIQNICNQNGITREEFAEKLATQGYTLDQYKEQIKQQIERSRLINLEVKSKIVITDDEITNYYASSIGGSSYDGPYYDLSLINIAPEDPEDPESKQAAEQRAVEAYKKLKDNVPFAEVAAEYSSLPSASEGGKLGRFSADEMDPFIRDIILKLKPGEFSKVIDMPQGYQIFRLDGISSTQKVDVPEEEKEEIRKTLFNQKLEERFQEWLDDLRAKSSIRIML